MPGVRRLTVIVAGADPARLHAALSVAAAQAALGAPARIFLQPEAVALLHPPLGAPQDRRYGAAGLPTLAEMIGEAAALGVGIIACQSGLALCGLRADALPPGVETGGLVALLADAGSDRLLMA